MPPERLPGATRAQLKQADAIERELHARKIAGLKAGQGARLVVLDAGGRTSKALARAATEVGGRRVSQLVGGFAAWKASGQRTRDATEVKRGLLALGDDAAEAVNVGTQRVKKTVGTTKERATDKRDKAVAWLEDPKNVGIAALAAAGLVVGVKNAEELLQLVGAYAVVSYAFNSVLGGKDEKGDMKSKAERTAARSAPRMPAYATAGGGASALFVEEEEEAEEEAAEEAVVTAEAETEEEAEADEAVAIAEAEAEAAADENEDEDEPEAAAEDPQAADVSDVGEATNDADDEATDDEATDDEAEEAPAAKEEAAAPVTEAEAPVVEAPTAEAEAGTAATVAEADMEETPAAEAAASEESEGSDPAPKLQKAHVDE